MLPKANKRLHFLRLAWHADIGKLFENITRVWVSEQEVRTPVMSMAYPAISF